jgi:hypothetical protein
VSKDELDDLLILDAWLRRHHAEVCEVPVDPSAPQEAVPKLRAAIDSVRASAAVAG